MQFDHLSTDKFWDLVYSTAKDRKRKKKLWRSLMAPEYVDVVLTLADSHISRIRAEIEDLIEIDWVPEDDHRIVSKRKAIEFITGIKGQATYYSERHRAAQKNIRHYAFVQDLTDYVEYLKDTIEDLRSCVSDEEIDFDLATTLDSFLEEPQATTQIDEWLRAREERRDGRQD